MRAGLYLGIASLSALFFFTKPHTPTTPNQPVVVSETIVTEASVEAEEPQPRGLRPIAPPPIGDNVGEVANIRGTLLSRRKGKLFVQAGEHLLEISPASQDASWLEAGCEVMVLTRREFDHSLTALSLSRVAVATRPGRELAQAFRSKNLVALGDERELTVLGAYIRQFNGGLSPDQSMELAAMICETARENSLEPELLASLVATESAFRADAVSPVGALGYGQLMPETARELGVNPRDDEQNLRGAARYLSQQMHRFGGKQRLALAAYNAGPGAVSRYRGVPPYQETRDYVRIISRRHRALQDALAALS